MGKRPYDRAEGLNGRIQQADVPDRNTINERGEMTATLLIGGNRRAVRWTPAGKASFLPALPGHTWTNVWSINDNGIVSGWSRKQPTDDGENNPVIWDASGKVIPLKTSPVRADGAAEATNRSGLSVGYLGNLGTDGVLGVKKHDPSAKRRRLEIARGTTAPVWDRPRRPTPSLDWVDVNDKGPKRRGMSAHPTNTGFSLSAPRIWRTAAATLKPIPVPRGLTEKPGRRHQPERHQQPRRHRRQRATA